VGEDVPTHTFPELETDRKVVAALPLLVVDEEIEKSAELFEP
jgi:hypothetical protein